MADTFKKIVKESPPVNDPPADAWKDQQVEKEHQPAKVKSTLTYRQMESQVANMDKQITAIQDRKAAMEADMAKVKTAAES